MPRKPKLTIIDQRLAAAAHKRQAATIMQVEAIAGSIELQFLSGRPGSVVYALLQVIQGDGSESSKTLRFAEIVNNTITLLTTRVMREQFKRVARASHAWMVKDYLEIIPKAWLVAKLPPQLRTAFECIKFRLPKVCLSFDHGTLQISELAPLETSEYVDEVAWFRPTISATRLTLEETDDIFFGVPVDKLMKTNISDEDKREIIWKIVFPPPSEREIAEIVTRGETIVNKETGEKKTIYWQDRMDALSHKIADKKIAFRELVRGYANGENIQQIKKRIKPLVSNIISSAQRIARTEGLRIAERIQRRSWDQLGDLMDGVQVLAILDQNTRPHHALRNGTVYYKDASKANGTTTKAMDSLPDLPDEPNCRCWTTPILTPPEEIETDPKLREALRTTASPGVPDPASYEDWWRDAKDAEKKLVVGVKRYELLKDQLKEVRHPEFSDFIDEEGKLLPIDKLAHESELDRQKRKQFVKLELDRRKRLVEKISERGFEFPPIEPTQIPGITFSRNVDPTSEVDLLGEVIRGHIAKMRLQNEKQKGASDLDEKQVRKVGKLMRKYLYTPGITKQAKRIGAIVTANDQDHLKIDRLRVGEANARSEKEKERLRRKQQALFKRIASRRSELRELQESLDRMKQTRYAVLMSAIRDMGHDKPYPLNSLGDPEVARLIQESQRFFPTDWLNTLHGRMLVPQRASRGYYNGREIAVSTDRVEHRTRSTAVHEMWHAVQDQVFGENNSELEMYSKRTKWSKTRETTRSRLRRKLNPKIDAEFTKRDRWLGNRKPGIGEYMGRDYGSKTHAEVGTMTIEGILYSTYPIEQDPEAVDLVLGLLASR